MAMGLTPQKPTQRARVGEIPEDLPGSTKSVVGVERSVRNWGGPTGSDRERKTRGSHRTADGSGATDGATPTQRSAGA
jgi:hypothetical protein